MDNLIRTFNTPNKYQLLIDLPKDQSIPCFYIQVFPDGCIDIYGNLNQHEEPSSELLKDISELESYIANHSKHAEGE